MEINVRVRTILTNSVSKDKEKNINIIEFTFGV